MPSWNDTNPLVLFILGVIDEALAMESRASITMRDRIIEQMDNNPKITRKEWVAVLGVTPDGVKYHLQKMIAEGIITRRGSTRNGYWELIR